jgi:parallel beta-helix repeat protein
MQIGNLKIKLEAEKLRERKLGKKMLAIGMILLMVFVVYAGIPVNVSAEETNDTHVDPLEDPLIAPLPDWIVEETGTNFEITNSEYLNIKMTSNEIIQVYIESIPSIVSYSIETESTTTSTTITLEGFEASKTYYRYQDGYLQEEFITDISGAYSYTQDLTTPHHVYIQEESSTLYISSDYTFTSDIYDSIVVAADNIVIDGNGYTLYGSGSGYGIYLNSKSGITVTKVAINGFSCGIHLEQSSTNTISENTVSDTTEGISLKFSSTGNTISDNTVLDSDNGIYMFSAPGSTITGNEISARIHGFYLERCHGSTLVGNTVLGGVTGIRLYSSTGSTAEENTVLDSTFCGLYLDGSHGSIVTSNTISGGSNIGLLLRRTPNCLLRNNEMILNKYNIHVDGYATSFGNGFHQDIDISNTVDGKPIYYWVGRSHETIPYDAGFVGLVDSDNIIVEGLTLTNNGAGVLTYNTKDSIIRNNAVSNNAWGINIIWSTRNTITGNTGLENYASVHLNRAYSNTVSGNTISGASSRYGIRTQNSWENIICDNTVSITNIASSQSGINLVDTFDSTVSGNMVYGGYDGIYVWGARNTISDNTIIDAAYRGIFITSDGCTVEGNTISGSFYCIWVRSSDDGMFSENTFSNNNRGVFLQNAHSNTFSRNTISCNDGYGIWLHFSNGNTFFHNNIIDNYDQLRNEGTWNTWDNGAGEGNYWSNYGGEDLDGDGVGDTYLPHEGADYYPLMSPWSPNDPPVANAGPDQTVIVGETVYFDGSGSTDPDGTIISYNWDFGDTNTGTGVTTTHSYINVGTYTVTLTVTDDYGATDTDTMEITVITSEQATLNLINTVLALNLDDGIENSFVSKLQNAIKSISNDRPSAEFQMGAFINEVNAQRGISLSDAEADMLIGYAQWIIDNI